MPLGGRLVRGGRQGVRYEVAGVGAADEEDRLGVWSRALLDPGKQAGRVVGGAGSSGAAEVGLGRVGIVGVLGAGVGAGGELPAGGVGWLRGWGAMEAGVRWRRE
jgi:hypothetical protein